MKKCPFCAEEIQDAAIKCKHCSEMLNQPAAATSPEKKPVSQGSGKGIGCIATTCLVVIAVVVSAVAVSGWAKGEVRLKRQQQLIACKQNCKNLATALENYASDNQGYYPVTGNLQVLTTGNYLIIPYCPTGDNYSGSYESTHVPKDSYKFNCLGDHTWRGEGVCRGFPQYDSEAGLTTSYFSGRVEKQ